MYQLTVIMVTGDTIKEDHLTYEKAKKSQAEYEKKYGDHVDVSFIINTADRLRR